MLAETPNKSQFSERLNKFVEGLLKNRHKLVGAPSWLGVEDRGDHYRLTDGNAKRLIGKAELEICDPSRKEPAEAEAVLKA